MRKQLCFFIKKERELNMYSRYEEKVSSEMVDYVEDSLKCMLEEVEIMYDGDSNVKEIVEGYKVEIENVMSRLKN